MDDSDVIKYAVLLNLALGGWIGRRIISSIDSLSTRINDHAQRLAVLEVLCDVRHKASGEVDRRG